MTTSTLPMLSAAAAGPGVTDGLAAEEVRFAEALRDDSNLAEDWPWLATQVTSDDRRRYCFLRALSIDPANREARDDLARHSYR